MLNTKLFFSNTYYPDNNGFIEKYHTELLKIIHYTLDAIYTIKVWRKDCKLIY